MESKDIKATIKEWIRQFIAQDNTKINTGTIFAVVGFVTGWLAFILYAFILREDIGPNLSNILMAMMGVGGTGFVASLFQKYGGAINIPPNNGDEK